jgi:hypothetical protein
MRPPGTTHSEGSVVGFRVGDWNGRRQSLARTLRPARRQRHRRKHGWDNRYGERGWRLEVGWLFGGSAATLAGARGVAINYNNAGGIRCPTPTPTLQQSQLLLRRILPC